MESDSVRDWIEAVSMVSDIVAPVELAALILAGGLGKEVMK
jgi:hypothetical protein